MVGGGHLENGTSLQEWVEVVADRRLTVVEELQQTLAWIQGSDHQEGVEEARASLVEHWEVQEMGLAVQGATEELGFRETGCYGVDGVCWV